MKYLVIFCIAMLAACATPIETTKLSQFTHADLQNAAAIATANGYPARAAVWTSNAVSYTHLTLPTNREV